MGYYTEYKLSWTTYGDMKLKSCEHTYDDSFNFCPFCGKPSSQNNIDAFVSDWMVKNDFDGLDQYAIERDGSTHQSATWYDHDKDMRNMSAQLNNILFTLYGNGEESNDIWRKYYLNGKCQEVQAKIVFDEFDECKLK